MRIPLWAYLMFLLWVACMIVAAGSHPSKAAVPFCYIPKDGPTMCPPYAIDKGGKEHVYLLTRSIARDAPTMHIDFDHLLRDHMTKSEVTKW